jgi:hypothetical protein
VNRTWHNFSALFIVLTKNALQGCCAPVQDPISQALSDESIQRVEHTSITTCTTTVVPKVRGAPKWGGGGGGGL